MTSSKEEPTARPSWKNVFYDTVQRTCTPAIAELCGCLIRPDKLIRKEAMVNVRLADTSDSQRWDTYVLGCKDAGPYHLYAWKRAVEESYGHQPYYLMAEDGEQRITGVLPLFLVTPPLLKGVLVSLPFCDYGGALASGKETLDALHRAALDHASRLHNRLEIRLRDPDPTLMSSCNLGVLSHKSRMVLGLPVSSDELWGSFKSKLRSQIKRPRKDGLEFVLGSVELVEDFYRVFTVNMHELGSPVHSRRWIESIVRSFGERAHVGIVYAGSLAVAGGIILETNDLVAIPWASTLQKYSRSSPNMLLYWGFLAYACDRGYKRFDFGRSTPGEGTYRFKEQWGAHPYPLYWYGSWVGEGLREDMSSGKLREHVARIWARMPFPIVNQIGPVLRRYITL